MGFRCWRPGKIRCLGQLKVFEAVQVNISIFTKGGWLLFPSFVSYTIRITHSYPGSHINTVTYSDLPDYMSRFLLTRLPSIGWCIWCYYSALYRLNVCRIWGTGLGAAWGVKMFETCHISMWIMVLKLFHSCFVEI